MKIILKDKTKIEVKNIHPTGNGLVIDTAATQLADIEQLITSEKIETISCIEGDTTFARYTNLQLESLSKDSGGVHICTRYKMLHAEVDVSKMLTDMQNEILQIKNDVSSVQDVQDVQNVAIAEIGGLVSQNMIPANESGEEVTKE